MCKLSVGLTAFLVVAKEIFLGHFEFHFLLFSRLKILISPMIGIYLSISLSIKSFTFGENVSSEGKRYLETRFEHMGYEFQSVEKAASRRG